MANFLARVELHNAVYTDYERLHIEMAHRGFYRTILGDNGVNYHLPPAEYNGTGDVSLVTARTVVKAAADATGKLSAVLVVQWLGAAWEGLSVA